MIPRSVRVGNDQRFGVTPRRAASPAPSQLLWFVLVGLFPVAGAGCDVKVRDEEDGAAGAAGAAGARSATGNQLAPGSPGSWKADCAAKADCKEANAACLAIGNGSSARVCTGALDRSAYLQECAGNATGAAAVCAGLACQALNPNRQGRAGICTLAGCASDADCGAGAHCFAQGAQPICLAGCTSAADCPGFACVIATPAVSVCLVEMQ